MRRQLEICAASLASALAAQVGGAQRVELCQGLEQGGLTPSYGLIKEVRARLRIPVFVLIRPRAGDFVYSPEELATMRADIALGRELDCDGVVLGVLDAAGRVDMAQCRNLIELARPLPVTFHRAFDECANQAQALEDVIALGCERLLTSGGQATAAEGQAQLAALVRQAAGRLSIMPGAGINAGNLADLAAFTGASEFHTSARRELANSAAPGLFTLPRYETDAALVAGLVGLLRS